MTNSALIGFARKSKSGNAIRLELSKDAFNEAETYQSRDGHEFVRLILNIQKLEELLVERREVAAVCQLTD